MKWFGCVRFLFLNKTRLKKESGRKRDKIYTYTKPKAIVAAGVERKKEVLRFISHLLLLVLIPIFMF